ncbi:MAG: hypothetical protein A2033_15445 [Bacteroidetes bacterium GWA2_31_9]|nr:MAG: hypothetical protein A2033_15445 [Bacteroidetes bacterium GWA2_31_9]
MKKKIKILCIGDSLTLPRNGVNYEDTWFYLIKQNFLNFEFISSFKRAITSNILNEHDSLELYSPDYAIIQLGIVDCAPRLINKGSFSYYLIKLLPKQLQNQYIRLLKKISNRGQNNVYVKKDRFKQNFTNYFNRCQKYEIKKVFVIAICYPDDSLTTKNPLIYQNVNVYNNILIELANKYSFVELLFLLDGRLHKEKIYDDGYHPNSYGNKLVSESLIDNLFKIN